MDVLHLSPAEYCHVLAVLRDCDNVLTGTLNEGQALKVLKSYYGVDAFHPYRIQVHFEVPDDYRLSFIEREGVPEDAARLAYKLEFARSHWLAVKTHGSGKTY